MLPVPALNKKLRRFQTRLETHLAAEATRPQYVPTYREWSARYFPARKSKPNSPFHDWLMDRIDENPAVRGTRYCTLAPRSSGKSEHLTFRWPLYNALHKLEPYQVIGSDTCGQADLFLTAIQSELRFNELLRRDYGRLCDPGQVWRQNRLQFSNGAVIASFGQDRPIRGTKNDEGERPSLILIDDPEGKKHLISGLRRDQSERWLYSDVMESGRPDGTTNVFMIGTAICPECLVLRVRDKAGWAHRIFPAVYPMPTRMDLWHEWKAVLNNFGKAREDREADALAFYRERKADMDLPGNNILWPEMYTLYDKMVIWATALGTFNTEHQGVPYDPEALYFNPDYFEGDVWFDDWPADDVTVLKLITLDPSLGETKRSDYQAFVLWAMDRNGREYVDCVMGREDVPGMAFRGVGLYERFRPREFVVESNGWQKLLAPSFQTEMDKAGCLLMTIYEMVDHIAWGKEIRIEQLSEPLNRGKIRFKRNSPGAAMLIQQLKEYPFGMHDDGPDALSMARIRAMDYIK